MENTPLFFWMVPIGYLAVLLLSFLKNQRSKIVDLDNDDMSKHATDPQTQIRDIESLVDYHETAAVLAELIHTDGAGAWPPRANHTYSTWPESIRGYTAIYEEMAPLIPQETPSLDDEVNKERIESFRSRFRKLLQGKVDLVQVRSLLEAAEAGRWDVFPRDMYNAFYCCISWSRHAYRWATIPVVKVAQRETIVDLPVELVEPWEYLQRHFGCTSQAGSSTSNAMLNFDTNGKHMFRFNIRMPEKITMAEEYFSRIFYDIEITGLPIYHDMVLANIEFARGDKAACLRYMKRITNQLRPALATYYDNLHNGKVAISVWLSHVQGFFAWSAGYVDEKTGEYIKFDGLSGNAALLFHAVDGFLGYDPYLSYLDQERDVPVRQRAVAHAFKKYCFRHKLSDAPQDEGDAAIAKEFNEMVKRMRVFRSAHRMRSKQYLFAPAPERVPMTAGKSVLKADTMDQSFPFLDVFMVQRLNQTV
ncbi:uncharacterized protein F4822DRAFT_387985 [Hypoxylon trugodes]|uniref:uncharacterized protein n=1 Tax=Hypoxylon trugodes TaxID=326681 RepID=UPI0021964DFD|nr:uncharacterized protein F4822DRAFT_387985 [Hypoxylon trugodes]KAI1394364.1 hypothetical protein F4822DRAFT_387985 [Hypoxylon trugodes]